jgi:hypothetical protein
MDERREVSDSHEVDSIAVLAILDLIEDCIVPFARPITTKWTFPVDGVLQWLILDTNILSNEYAILVDEIRSPEVKIIILEFPVPFGIFVSTEVYDIHEESSQAVKASRDVEVSLIVLISWPWIWTDPDESVGPFCADGEKTTATSNVRASVIESVCSPTVTRTFAEAPADFAALARIWNVDCHKVCSQAVPIIRACKLDPRGHIALCMLMSTTACDWALAWGWNILYRSIEKPSVNDPGLLPTVIAIVWLVRREVWPRQDRALSEFQFVASQGEEPTPLEAEDEWSPRLLA